MQIDLYNDSPTGTPGGKKNWVDKAGGLPGPIRARYRALRRENPGWTKEHCYAVAVNAVKHSAATGDSKLPGKQNQRKSKVAAHTKAAIKWQKMKASTHKDMSYDEVIGEVIELATTITRVDTQKKKGKILDADKDKNKKVKPGDKEKEGTGKIGAASDGNKSPEDLKKTIKGYLKNKSKYTPEQRKKIEARIKSSKQQQGKKGVM